MEASFAQWVVGQGGIAGIACLALWLLNRTYQDALRRERENAETHRQDKERMIQALEKNAEVMARLDNAMSELVDWGRVGYEAAGAVLPKRGA